MKLKTLLLLLLVLLGTKGSSQVVFGEQVITDHTFGVLKPDDTTVADLDGDGDMDIIVFPLFFNEIVWYENLDGLGTYGLKKFITTDLNGARDIFPADIDSDGDLDILLASDNDNTISWYENINGLGIFGPRKIISSSIVEASVIIAIDVDSDGDLDVATGSYEDDTISWFQNLDGLGNFSTKIEIGSNIQGPRQLYVNDADNDGDSDLYYIAYGKTGYFENTYTEIIINDEPVPFDVHHEVGYTSSGIKVIAEDLDMDGDVDMVVAAANDDTIAWFQNDGFGNYGEEQIITSLLDDASSVALIDMDSDGDLDVLASSNLDAKVVWFENINGQGSFGAEQIFSTDFEYPSGILVTDIDNDTKLDVVVTHLVANRINWHKNIDGLGNFGIPTEIGNIANRPLELFPADVDGDGDLDILSASRFDNKIAWYENLDGQGTFGIQQVITSQAYAAFSVSAADVDGDGDIDVFSATRDDHSVSWYENLDGLGTFSPAHIISTQMDLASSVRTADIDGDGDIDVVASSQQNNSVVWFKNLDGLGSFGTAQIVDENLLSTQTCLITDIDGDGDMDIAGSSYASFEGIIKWYENTDGLGNFSTGQTITTEVRGVVSLFASDLDGDTDMDLFAASLLNGKITWYENTDGSGTFGPEQIIDSTEYPESVASADLDGDGDADVFACYGINGKYTWYENLDGQGTLSPQKIISLAPSPNFVAPADINGDGAIDIITSDDHSLITWRENLGGETLVYGSTRFDINDDGCIGSEITMSNIMVTSLNGPYSFSSFTDANGNYQNIPGQGIITTSIVLENETGFNIYPENATSNLLNSGDTDEVNFCVSATQQLTDISISILPVTEARPGFDSDYMLVFENNGTTLLDGTIEFEFLGENMSFLEADHELTSQTENALEFTFTNFVPFETREILMSFNILPPPINEINEILSFTATINPVDNDINPEDNVFLFDQILIGSFDPNDIQVVEGAEIHTSQVDEYLHYIIRFQNTGTASAINIRVENVLDDNLDWNTMQPLSLSHLGDVKIIDGNQVSFNFQNINLPAYSNDEEGSNGYIIYKIKPNSTLEVGDSVSNTADIFFDFNQPIITNTVTTTVVDNLGMIDLLLENIQLYPVPTSELLFIKSRISISEINIINNLGQLILSQKDGKGINEVDVSKLTEGIYSIELKSLGGESTYKRLIKL